MATAYEKKFETMPRPDLSRPCFVSAAYLLLDLIALAVVFDDAGQNRVQLRDPLVVFRGAFAAFQVANDELQLAVPDLDVEGDRALRGSAQTAQVDFRE